MHLKHFQKLGLLYGCLRKLPFDTLSKLTRGMNPWVLSWNKRVLFNRHKKQTAAVHIWKRVSPWVHIMSLYINNVMNKYSKFKTNEERLRIYEKLKLSLGGGLTKIRADYQNVSKSFLVHKQCISPKSIYCGNFYKIG